jgi:hypothetical protein
MHIKVAMVSVIGPKPTSPHFPQDLELHRFARKLLEEDNKNIQFTWFLGSHKNWGIASASGPNVSHYEFDSSTIEELKFEHPSLDHGAMLNALLGEIGIGFDFVIVLDPDCFVVGEGSLQSLLSTMVLENISVAGTPYGMQFPKGYFRDFPAAFFMVFATKSVDVSKLDFRILHDFKASFGGKIRPQTIGSGTYRNKVKDVLRRQVASVIRFAFGLDNPLRWWGFLDEFKSKTDSLPLANDTGFMVRKALIDTFSHMELRVIQKPSLVSDASGKNVAARNGDESLGFGSSRYFRNHGVFEGWKLIKFDLRALVMMSFVVAYLRKIPRIEARFPISSMTSVEKVTHAETVQALFSRFPEIDIWSFNGSPIAVHLGYGTKNSLASTGDWPALVSALRDLRSSATNLPLRDL